MTMAIISTQSVKIMSSIRVNLSFAIFLKASIVKNAPKKPPISEKEWIAFTFTKLGKSPLKNSENIKMASKFASIK